MYFRSRSTALQWYWTLYVVIAGGLLAFSSLRQRPDALTGILVTVLFGFFAYKNLDAIHDVTLQRLATLQLIHAGGSSPLDPTLITPDYEGVRNFHITSDLLIIAALWAMEWA